MGLDQIEKVNALHALKQAVGGLRPTLLEAFERYATAPDLTLPDELAELLQSDDADEDKLKKIVNYLNGSTIDDIGTVSGIIRLAIGIIRKDRGKQPAPLVSPKQERRTVRPMHPHHQRLLMEKLVNDPQEFTRVAEELWSACNKELEAMSKAIINSFISSLHKVNLTSLLPPYDYGLLYNERSNSIYFAFKTSTGKLKVDNFTLEDMFLIFTPDFRSKFFEAFTPKKTQPYKFYILVTEWLLNIDRDVQDGKIDDARMQEYRLYRLIIMRMNAIAKGIKRRKSPKSRTHPSGNIYLRRELKGKRVFPENNPNKATSPEPQSSPDPSTPGAQSVPTGEPEALDTSSKASRGKKKRKKRVDPSEFPRGPTPAEGLDPDANEEGDGDEQESPPAVRVAKQTDYKPDKNLRLQVAELLGRKK